MSNAPTQPSQSPRPLTCVLFALVTLVCQTAFASDTDHCVAVRERAKADAAVLMAPRVFAQALRFPFNVDLGPGSNNGVQLRVGLSFSPVDWYRGHRLDRLSDSDCQAFEARTTAERALTDATGGPTLVAYRAQLAFMESRRAEWQRLLAQAQQLLDAHLITLIEFEDFLRRVHALERKLEDARGSIAHLEARGVQPAGAELPALAATYVEKQLELEGRLSGLKSLDAWNMRLVGGGIPSPNQQAGWFGWIEVSYSFGGLFHGSHEAAYLKARRAELATAAHEVPAQLQTLGKDVEATVAHVQRELDLVEQHLTLVTRTKTLLATANTPTATFEQGVFTAEELLAQSERTYWNALKGELTRFLPHGSSIEYSR